MLSLRARAPEGNPQPPAWFLNVITITERYPPVTAATPAPARRYPIGAELTEGGASFRVWAPRRSRVAVVLAGEFEGEHPLQDEGDGYFSGFVAGAWAGARYRFRLDDDDTPMPDPASRWQPEGPHGPSAILDTARYRWGDAGWQGLGLEGQVIYEMHVGTFTPEGSWAAAARLLPQLKDIGITVIEMMPVAEFPGDFGWGYDGVNMFAPTRLYGEPDDLKRFIDAAHGLGMGVILDVVYNHFGPDGNYTGFYAREYTACPHINEWGDAINFDGPGSASVREFFLTNARYWIEEYRFDGLRLDATQALFDDGAPHIIAEIARTVRDAAAGRATIIVGENEPQLSALVRARAQGGFGLDALWNDDLHHSAMVAVTGRREAYYHDHLGTPQELISAAKYGYLFQGQLYSWQKQGRGTPGLDLAPQHFVTFIQNHDQVANSARGLRVQQLSGLARARAITAYLLLIPGTPMLFQGQEFFATTPFYYFAHHGDAGLAEQVRKGRLEFLEQFPNIDADPAMKAAQRPPHLAETFAASKLDWAEFIRNAGAVALHRDLLRLRREDPVFSVQRARGLDGAVLGPEAFLLRFFGPDGDDRLMLVNLGMALTLQSVPEPLLAPPACGAWELLFSSESPAYDGCGTAPIVTPTHWHLPAQATVVLRCNRAGTTEKGPAA